MLVRWRAVIADGIVEIELSKPGAGGIAADPSYLYSPYTIQLDVGPGGLDGLTAYAVAEWPIGGTVNATLYLEKSTDGGSTWVPALGTVLAHSDPGGSLDLGAMTVTYTAISSGVHTVSITFGAGLADLIPVGHGINCNAFDQQHFYGPPWVAAGAFAKTPPGNGELLGSLEPMRAWCRANGISVALNQDSQRSAKDLLDELFTVGNSAPVYSGDRLKIIPYDEVSAAGHGAIYVAPTAAGPIADLDDRDFPKDGFPTFKRKRRADCDNVVAIEHIDRALDYAHNVTSEPDQMAIALYGPRKGGTLDAAELGVNVPSGSKSLLSIHSAEVAQKIGSILAKRGAAGVNEYRFTLKHEWLGLEAMDLVTITDARLGLVQTPVRLTSAKEGSKRTLNCTAESFVYGLNHPDVKGTALASGTLVNASVDPGLVNAPIILQPPAAMLTSPTAAPELWFIVSGADPNYGGCVAFVSVDGGTNYDPIGNIGPGTTGVLTADFADGTDPDSTHTLAVDLTESGGELNAQTVAVADGFADPCYLEGSDAYTWEAICYTARTLTSAYHYSLATYIRRGVLGTAHAAHATGKRFGAVDGSVLKVALPSVWVGTALKFKFAAYNKLGGQQNSLADCAVYSYTPAAIAAPGTYYGRAQATAALNTVATLDSIPLAGTERISLAGLLLTPGVDYTIAGAVVTATSSWSGVMDFSWVTANPTPGGVTLSGSAAFSPAIRGTGIQASSAGSYTVSWPSGTVAGDLAVICAGHGWSINTPSGWTSIDNSAGGNWNGAAFYRVLDSTDIATGSVAVTAAGSYDGVVGIVTFVGATAGIRETVVIRSSSGTASEGSLTTSGAPVATDTAIYFGSNRANSTDSVTRGTMQQQATDGSAASGCLYTEDLASSGAVNPAFNFSGAGIGYYVAIVIVKGV